MTTPADAVRTAVVLCSIIALPFVARVEAAEPTPSAPPKLVPAEAEECRDQPVLVGQTTRQLGELFDRVTTPSQHAQMLGCAYPAGTRGAWPGAYWGETLVLAYLARSEYAGGDPVMVAFALNAYARLMVRPGAPFREQRRTIAAVIAGYHRIMPLDEITRALRAALPPALAEVLVAGCSEAVDDARAQGPEDALWTAYETYATEAAPVAVLLRELRAQAASGATEAVLARLDSERQALLDAAKDREAALRSPAFRELTGIARAISSTSGAQRPFEQLLPEPLLPTWILATTKDRQRRALPLTSSALDGVEMAWRVVRAGEFGRDKPTAGSNFFVARVKKVGRDAAGKSLIELDNKKTTSYAGQCRTTLVFVDAAGQGWGTERCSGSAEITTTEGPSSVTLPTASVAALKNGHYIEYYADQAGASGHLVRVWDAKFDKLLAIGPFRL